MINLSVVTGYVPIPGHPRTSEEYGKLGEEIFGALTNALVPVTPFYENISACWLWNAIKLLPFPVTPCVADNPKKNTIAYHCVQHQKFRWLTYAAFHDPRPDVFIWIDYGIGHVPGVTAAVIYKFLEQVEKNDFAIPGCWPEHWKFETSDSPDWRFCGGLMVVPRGRVNELYSAVREAALSRIMLTKKVTWEVNILANIEKELKPRWYAADHNETMFTNYKDGK